MQKRNTIRVQTQVLTQYDYETAMRSMRPAWGVVVTEMMPRPTSIGGILVAGKRARDDIAMVLAAHPDTGYIPGTYVVVNYQAGKVIENFKAGAYTAQNEVRIFGRQPCIGETRERDIRRWKGKHRAILNSQIFGTVNVNMIPIPFVPEGSPIPISKRTSIETYEAYIRIEPGLSSSSKPAFRVQSLYGQQFERAIELEEGFAYRLTVKDDGGGQINVAVENIGPWTMETAFVTDRDIPFRPANTKCLIEMDDLIDKTEGGILLTADSSLRTCEATIVSVGPQVKDWEPGMRILIYASYLDRTNDIAMTGLNNKALKMIDEEGIACQILDNEEAA